ncbi:MAG: hypothetical protein D6771_04390 [Zetaproteobacteria bacterium]|nr:MAG: hypothetical protein D6771_04390 [Zetaproteobacteria bacterium]
MDFADATGWWELRDPGDPTSTWTLMLPKDLSVGQWVHYTSPTTYPSDIWYDAYGNPVVYFRGRDTLNIRVDVAKDANGAPYQVQDPYGAHLVYKVEVHGTTVRTPTNQCVNQDVYTAYTQGFVPVQSCQQFSTPFDFYSYVVSDYGVMVEALSPNETAAQALSRIQFGRILVDANGNFRGATLLNPNAQDPYGWGVLSKQLLDQWLAYAWNNRDRLGIFQPQQQQQQNFQPFFAVRTDLYGNPNVTPSPVDQYGNSAVLTQRATQQVSVVVDYAAPKGTESFEFEWCAGGQRIGAAVTATGATTGALSVQQGVTLSATLTVPSVGQLPPQAVYVDPFTNTQTGVVELWLVMKNGTALVQEMPIAAYLVQ